MKKRFLIWMAALLGAVSLHAQPQVIDCQCLRTQAVLNVTNCLAVVPDLCLFTQCLISTVQPPPPVNCSQSPTAGTPVGPGITMITVTVISSIGVVEQCVIPFTVTAPANGPFALICATNKTVECGTTWTFNQPTPTNFCCPPQGTTGNGVTLISVTTTTNGTCPQIITRTWTARDSCGHLASCSQVVTVVDTTPPGLPCTCLTSGNAAFPPIPLTVTNCSGVIPDFCQIALFCATDNCGPLTCTQSPPAGTIVGPGMHPITVSVRDCAGNIASCQLNFTVVAPATGPFALICAPNKTVECGTTWTFNPPTPTNYCCPPQGTVSNGVTLISVTTTTNGTCPKVFTRTWTARDGCGVVASCSQMVTVVDTTPPVLDCQCLQDPALVQLTVTGCSNVVPDLCLLLSTCATDICGPLTCSQSPPAGTIVFPGVHPITVTVTDCAGNKATCTINFTVIAPPGGCQPCTFTTNFWNSGMGGGIALPTGATDPNYVLVSAPPGGCTGPAQVINPSTIPSPPWVANGPNSQWISAGPNANCQPGVYHYRLCFYMPCTNDASIIGQWAVDDNGAIHLNGQPTGNTIPSQQYPNLPGYGWFPLSITNGFVCGTNCLDFYVTNAIGGINPTGLRAELTNFFNDCCCPPVQKIGSVNSGADINGLLAPQAPDNQFALTCAPPGVTATVPVVIHPTAIPSTWLPNSTTSQWIGPDAFNNAPAGVYCYTMTFTLPCPPGTPMKASLTGRWTADDWASIQLNGQPTGHSVPSVQFPLNGFDAWHPISITNGFVSGLNSLTFYVTNAGGPTGLRLEMDINSSCCDCTNILCDITITCPPNVTNYTCGNSAVVSYLAPSVSGTCPPITTICAPPSGSTFPLGNSPVTCTATDAQGNSKSCSFVVTVIRHTQPWQVTCPPLNLSVTGCPPVLPDLCSLVTITTNCPFPGPLTCTIFGPNGQPMPPGTVLPSGTTVVIVRICDGAGNCRDCDVIINAVTPPGCYPCCPVGATAGPELVINPAFSAGNTGFTSDYGLLSPTCSPGLYTVATSLTVGGMCNNWACIDHTTGSTTGNFFVADGSQTLGQAAWRQQVTLSPSTQYSLCAWVNNLNVPSFDRADPIVQVWLVPASGPAVLLTSSGPLPETPDVWVQLSASWSAPAVVSNPYRLEFRTASTSFEGNNFAIDDISFRACLVGCTTTPVLTLNSGANASGVLPAGSLDPQFLTGAPMFSSPNPWVPNPIPGSWVPNSALSKWVSPRATFVSVPAGVYVYTNRFFLCSTNQAVLTGRWTADNSGGLWLNGAPTGNTLPVGTAFTSWHPVNITSGFVPGWNTLTFVVTNSGGPSGLRTEIRGRACCNTCVAITCPPNQTRTNCPPGGTVTYPAPSATSSCGNIVSLGCTPPSGSFFPLGTNTVTCTAIDAQGNAATCSFTVTVRPAAGPVSIMCPPNQTILTCGNNAVAYYKAKATGQTGPILCTPPSGTTFPLGTNVVTCTATNICGQSVSCSFLVIVKKHPLGVPALTITAGNPDNFVLPIEPSPQSACMVAAFGGFPFWKGFDQVASDRLFGHRFTGLPNNVVQAQLIVRMKPTSDGGAANDGIFVGLPTCLFASFRYSASIAALPAAGGNWNPGHVATTFIFNLGVLNPAILTDISTQGYLDVVVHDDTTVDFMQLRIWRCPPPSPGIGVPFEVVGGAITALRPILGTGIGISPKPAICVFPNPLLPSGISLQPGAAKSLSFTTVLDFDAPEGAGLDLVLPPDPRNTNGMPYLSFRNKGAKGYCVKTAKLYDDEPDISYRSFAVGTNGDLFPSITWDAANIETNVLLWLNRLPGVTSVVMTVTIDLETREATLEFPDCLWTADHGRKGWDGCIYGNGTPSKGTNKTARLILLPAPPHTPLPPVFDLSLLATGLAEFLVEAPEIETMGRKWGDGHVTLMKAYDDGETERLSFITVGEGGGVHTDLGHAATFSVGFHHFENDDIPDEAQVFRLTGPIRGLTNRPSPPQIPLRLAEIPGGVACSVDFSDLAAESITVQLWSGGVLVAQGTGEGSSITPESPLIIDRWPDRFGRPALNEGYLSLSSAGEPFSVSGILGDELRFIPGLPSGVEFPPYFSRFECDSSDGMDNVLFDLRTTLACPPDPIIHIDRGTDGVVLTWDCDGYLLQGAESVTGPWIDLDVDSPATMATRYSLRFFKLRGR